MTNDSPYRQVDVGTRDPDHPYRSVLPWRNKRKVENYTICCPRCGSYRLSDVHFVTLSKIVNCAFECDDCGSHGGIALIITRNGLMLATD